MSPATNFNTPVRMVKNFIQQNKANLASRTLKRANIVSKVENKNDLKNDSVDIKPENIKKDTYRNTARNSLMPGPVVDETKAYNFAALSPKVFRKTTFATEVLQREIKIPKLNMRRPSMRFDPAYNRKLPVYLDIPDQEETSNNKISALIISILVER